MSNEDYEVWLEGIERANYPRGVLPSETEVLIVGGGITGITAAYLLAKQGKKVVLLEKRKLGEWVTDCTTGFLTQLIDTGPDKLIKLFGIEKARLILASHSEAINNIEKIIKSENIECEFKRCANYLYANTSGEEKDFPKIAEAFKKLGVKAEYKKDNTLKFSKFGYIELADEAKFHVMKYLTALAKLAKNYGAVIVENTEVLSLDDKKDFVVIEIKDAGTIKAEKVFSATYLPFKEPSQFASRYNMYRSYVVEYKLPAGAFLESTYQDNLLPYHYFRIDGRDGYDRLLLGGADHIEAIEISHDINYQVIKKYTEKLFAGYKYEEVRHWSGLILNSVDGLPYIGELKNGNIFYAFAFSGNGMTYSYIAGKIFLDQLTAQANPYSKIYDADRKISWWANIFG
jgi:glycine/D-amino acid oxidase-like deaminating enzyme